MTHFFFLHEIKHFKCSLQWRSVGSWHPGQELKLAPPFLDFFLENFQISLMVHPKQILVIFKSEKQKNKTKQNKKKGLQFLFSHLRSSIHLYTFHDLIWTSLWPRCAKWLVYHLLCLVHFSAPLKWGLGHVPPFPPPLATPLVLYIIWT